MFDIARVDRFCGDADPYWDQLSYAFVRNSHDIVATSPWGDNHAVSIGTPYNGMPVAFSLPTELSAAYPYYFSATGRGVFLGTHATEGSKVCFIDGGTFDLVAGTTSGSGNYAFWVSDDDSVVTFANGSYPYRITRYEFGVGESTPTFPITGLSTLSVDAAGLDGSWFVGQYSTGALPYGAEYKWEAGVFTAPLHPALAGGWSLLAHSGPGGAGQLSYSSLADYTTTLTYDISPSGAVTPNVTGVGYVTVSRNNQVAVVNVPFPGSYSDCLYDIPTDTYVILPLPEGWSYERGDELYELTLSDDGTRVWGMAFANTTPWYGVPFYWEQGMDTIEIIPRLYNTYVSYVSSDGLAVLLDSNITALHVTRSDVDTWPTDWTLLAEETFAGDGPLSANWKEPSFAVGELMRVGGVLACTTGSWWLSTAAYMTPATSDSIFVEIDIICGATYSKAHIVFGIEEANIAGDYDPWDSPWDKPAIGEPDNRIVSVTLETEPDWASFSWAGELYEGADDNFWLNDMPPELGNGTHTLRGELHGDMIRVFIDGVHYFTGASRCKGRRYVGLGLGKDNTISAFRVGVPGGGPLPPDFWQGFVLTKEMD